MRERVSLSLRTCTVDGVHGIRRFARPTGVNRSCNRVRYHARKASKERRGRCRGMPGDYPSAGWTSLTFPVSEASQAHTELVKRCIKVSGDSEEELRDFQFPASVSWWELRAETEVFH